MRRGHPETPVPAAEDHKASDDGAAGASRGAAAAYYGSRATFFADVTGDRLADALVSNQ